MLGFLDIAFCIAAQILTQNHVHIIPHASVALAKRGVRHMAPYFLAIHPAPHHVVDNLVELWLCQFPDGLCPLSIDGAVLITALRVKVVVDGVFLVNISILAVLFGPFDRLVVCLAIVATLFDRLLYQGVVISILFLWINRRFPFGCYLLTSATECHISHGKGFLLGFFKCSYCFFLGGVCLGVWLLATTGFASFVVLLLE